MKGQRYGTVMPACIVVRHGTAVLQRKDLPDRVGPTHDPLLYFPANGLSLNLFDERSEPHGWKE